MAAPVETGFFEQTIESIQRFTTRQACATLSRSFDQAMPPITATFGSNEMQERMGRAWRLFADPTPHKEAFQFYYLDEATSGFPMPELPCQLEDIGVQGVIHGLHEADRKAVWQSGSRALYLFDRQQGWGLFWTKDARQLPHWESSFPLRYVIAWLGEGNPGLLAHAGAVGIDGRAVLLVGKGGSGKSTTSLSALAHGMEFLGDDYTLVQAGKQPTVHALSTAAKIDQGRLPMLGLTDCECHELGVTEETNKRVIYLETDFAAQFRRQSQLCAIMHPMIDANGPRIEPMSKAAMLRALAPSTIFQIPTNRQNVFKKLSQLVAELPCFCFRVGPDLSANASLLKEHLLTPTV